VVLDNVLHEHRLVSHFEERGEFDFYFVLPPSPDFMVVVFQSDAHFVEDS